jgi:tetratricopeptide (TPR) repeat protein
MADRVSELYGAGYARLMAGDWAGALETFDTALAILPPEDLDGPGELLNFRGLALTGLGRHTEAMAAHKAALAAGPRCPEFLTDLGDAHAALGQRQQAIAAYEEALSKALPGEEILDRIRAGLDTLG